MNPEYGERYRELFEKHWWWRARTELVIETLLRLKPANGWNRILDIGCGDGLFFPRLREFGEIEGVEPIADLVNPANPDRGRISICSFDRSFQPKKQYSLILMLDVLEHLEDPVGGLKHVRELLEAEGTVLINVPAFMTLWTNHDVVNQHFVRYTKAELQKVTAEAGLRIVEERYLYHWMFPAKLAVRMAERLFRLPPKPASVPRGVINQPLYLLSRLEQKTLSRISMPFGSSLMAVCTHPAAPD